MDNELSCPSPVNGLIINLRYSSRTKRSIGRPEMTSASLPVHYDHTSPPLSPSSAKQKEKLGAAQGVVLATIAGIIAWTSALIFAFISIR